MASESTPNAALQDQPKVESQNQPQTQPHEQKQDQQLSQAQVLSQAQPHSQEQPHEQSQEKPLEQPHPQEQPQEEQKEQLQSQVETPPKPQLQAQPQDQEQSQPEVQTKHKPQIQSQDQQQVQRKVRLQDQMKDQQTNQQSAQPQASPQPRPKSKWQIQRQALEAPTPVVEDKTFSTVVLQILGIAVAIALFFVMLAVVFKRHNLQPELDPCDDFYAYICGRYTGMHYTGDVFSDMDAELWRLVKDKVVTGADPAFAAVTTTPPPSRHSILNKIQALFASCLRPPVNDSTAPLKAFVDSQGLGFSGNVTAVDAVLTMLRLSYLYDVQSVLGAHLLAVMSQPRTVLLRALVNRHYVRWLGERPDNVSFSYRVLLDVYGPVQNADKVVQLINDTENVVRRSAMSAISANATPLEPIMEDKDFRYYGNGATKTLPVDTAVFAATRYTSPAGVVGRGAHHGTRRVPSYSARRGRHTLQPLLGTRPAQPRGSSCGRVSASQTSSQHDGSASQDDG
ncbi:hypothetical protein MTO96_021435 [Rhipicephalus appendiculatus]